MIIKKRNFKVPLFLFKYINKKLKLVREYINEKFTDDSDPIEDMGIGPKALIIKWFEDIGYMNYEIDEHLQIHYKRPLSFQHNFNITELPDNLHIEGYLDLEGCINITKLPKNLKVDRWLDISRTKISKLPNDLNVNDWIDIRGSYVNKNNIPYHLIDSVELGSTSLT